MRYIFELLGCLARWSCKQMNKTQAEGIFHARMESSEASDRNKSKPLHSLAKGLATTLHKDVFQLDLDSIETPNATSMTNVCKHACFTMPAPNHFS